MAPEFNEQSMPHPDDADPLAAEWANVGLCGGMFRPANGRSASPDVAYDERDDAGDDGIDESNWQPYQRCCL